MQRQGECGVQGGGTTRGGKERQRKGGEEEGAERGRRERGRGRQSEGGDRRGVAARQKFLAAAHVISVPDVAYRALSQYRTWRIQRYLSTGRG
eukprot:3656647-Rhodomonas_salina.1